MKSGSRSLAAWLALTGLSLVAAFTLLGLRPYAPPPRWDLIGCFALAAVGVVGCLVTVRGRAFPDVDGGVSARAWWPDLRAPWKGIGRLIWLMLLIFFIGTMLTFSPNAARMAEEGHVIRQVAVDKVLSSEREGRDRVSRVYKGEVRASIPYTDGAESRTGTVYTERPLRPGDRIWALYAPSAPGLGVHFDDDSASLEEQAGGRAGGLRTYFGPVLLLVLLLGALAYSAPRLPGSVKSALKQGRLRRLPVRVVEGRAVPGAEAPGTEASGEAQGGAGKSKGAEGQANAEDGGARPVPQLVLEGPHGQRVEAVLNRHVSPAEFARALADGPAPALYWIESGRQAGEGVLAFGDRYVRCTAVSRPGGAALTGTEPATTIRETPGHPRQIHRFPEWDAGLHTEGFAWLLLTLLALGVIALGVGTVASIALGVVAYAASLAGWQTASWGRTDRLKKQLPGSDAAESS